MVFDPSLGFDPVLVVIGLVTGLTVGLTGIGAGSLLTPLLLLLGVRPMNAIGASLINALIMKGIGAAQHRRQGTLSGKLLLPLLVGALPAAVLGASIVSFYSLEFPAHADFVLKVLIGLTLVGAAVSLLRQIVTERRIGRQAVEARAASEDPASPDLPLPRRFILLAIGFGFLTGLTISVTSIGAGSFLMPILIVVYASRLRIHRLIGTDVALGAAVGTVATFVYLATGAIQPGPLLWLLAGSVPGVLLSSRVVPRLSLNGARTAVCSVTVIVGTVTIYGGLFHG